MARTSPAGLKPRPPWFGTAVLRDIKEIERKAVDLFRARGFDDTLDVLQHSHNHGFDLNAVLFGNAHHRGIMEIVGSLHIHRMDGLHAPVGVVFGSRFQMRKR